MYSNFQQALFITGMKFESFFKKNNFKLKSNVMKLIKNKQLILLAGCFLMLVFLPPVHLSGMSLPFYTRRNSTGNQ
jgi:hypothetical protein